MDVLRLYPPPAEKRPLKGLYLEHRLHRQGKTCIYTDFIASLDGRIALKEGGAFRVPGALANARDWRLFQELAAQAEAVIVSTHHLRARARGQARDILALDRDLRAWRAAQGLPPRPALLTISASLELPPGLPTPLTVITGGKAPPERAAALRSRGIQVLAVGEEERVTPEALAALLPTLGFRSIYSAAGPAILRLLAAGRVLDRLYLTLRHRLLGGEAFKTLIEGPPLLPPLSLTPRMLAYDPEGEQWFCLFT